MSTSQTQLAPAPSHYTYTLPFTPPIPFPVNPSYPIQLPSLPPLKSAYTFALYSPLAPKLALATFSSHLLQLREQPRHQSAPEASVGLEGTIRELLLPIHDFDHKYRAAVPAVWDPPAPAPSPPLPASLKEDEEELSALAGGMKAGGGAAKEKDKGRKKDKKDGKEKRAIDESEKQDMMAAYKRWLVAREEKEKAKKGKGKAGAEAVAGVVLEGAGAGDEAGGWTVKTDLLQEWITELELIETLLQSLLLLTLLSASSLPQSLASSPPPPVPKKKSKNPERHSSTLDPEMLLDFLTDRIQIWRVMKDVGNIDVAVTGGTSSKTDGEGEEEEEKGAGEKDLVQEWWDSIVEPLFSPHLPPSLLPLHRRKLFPALSTSTTDALSETLSTRLVPAPSPFKVKDRSLLSLDRSARRRGAEEEKGKIAESPTMKRLMGFKGLKVGARKEGKDLLAGKVGEDAGEEVFKVPSMGMGRKKAPAVPPTASGSSRSRSASVEPSSHSHSGSGSLASTSTPGASSTTSLRKQPRKQDRPRPLGRTDSRLGLLGRREVSLARRSSVNLLAGAGTLGADKKKVKDSEVGTSDERKRKRKSVSPRKITSASSSSAILVPDTPSRPGRSSSIPLPSRSFTRTTSLPSFAALGAAFRPGAGDQPDFFGGGSALPPPPVLSGDAGGGGNGGMEWEDEGWPGGTMLGKQVEWCVPDT